MGEAEEMRMISSLPFSAVVAAREGSEEG